MRALYSLLALCCMLLISACQPAPEGPHDGSVALVSPDGSEHVFFVEIADEYQEQQKGLMHRTEMHQNHGMLFIFPNETRRSFWMKNTLIPLDIIYFDAEKNVVSVTTMVPCKADPCTTYPSDAPAQYALELNAGVAEGLDVGRGWKMLLLTQQSQKIRK